MLTYIAIIFPVALVAMFTLSVDFGMYTSAKSSLQAAADAAALHGASGLPDNTWEQRARRALGDHHLYGKKINSSQATMARGYWNSATRQFSTTANGVPAVRVILETTVKPPMVQVLGVSSVKVRAEAIARVAPPPGGAQARSDFDTLGSEFDAYDSTREQPPTSPGNGNGQFLGESGGDISLHSSDIYGNLANPDGAKFKDHHSDFHGGGQRETLQRSIKFEDVVIPPGTVNYGKVTVNNGTYTVSGKAQFTDLRFGPNSTLRLTGPTEIYVTGDADIKGRVETFGNLPRNLKVISVNGGTIRIDGSQPYSMDLYNPKGLIHLHTHTVLRGRIRGDSLKFHHATFYSDQSLLDLPRTPTLVR